MSIDTLLEYIVFTPDGYHTDAIRRIQHEQWGKGIEDNLLHYHLLQSANYSLLFDVRLGHAIKTQKAAQKKLNLPVCLVSLIQIVKLNLKKEEWKAAAENLAEAYAYEGLLNMPTLRSVLFCLEAELLRKGGFTLMAIQKLKRAVAISKTEPCVNCELLALNGLMKIHMELGATDTANLMAEEAILPGSKISQNGLNVRHLLDCADIFLKQGDAKKSREMVDKALALSENSWLKYEVLTTQLGLAKDESNQDEMLSLLKELDFDLLKKGELSLYAKAKINEGYYYLMCHKYQSAEAVLTEIKDIITQENHLEFLGLRIEYLKGVENYKGVVDSMTYKNDLEKQSCVQAQLAWNDTLSTRAMDEYEVLQHMPSEDDGLESLVYHLSHDLREPIRMVKSYNELVAKRFGGELPEEATEYMGYALDGAKRMDKMIMQLLDYSRIGRKVKNRSNIDLNVSLIQVTNSLAKSISERGAVIDSTTLPEIVGNNQEFNLIFSELIRNAIQSVPEKEIPKICIYARVTETDLVMNIADNGCGIDLSHGDNLMGLMQNNSSRGYAAGNGIGLALVKKTLEQYNGTVLFDSSSEDGTVCQVRIPKHHIVTSQEE